MSSSNSSKRPRRRQRIADATAAASNRDASSWASLHEDLVDLIAWRVLAGDFRDYIRFRAVCPHWRCSTVCPRGRGIVDPRFHPRRWMLFPEGRGLYPGHGKLHGYVRFFNLSTAVFVRVRLPIFRDHCVLYSVDGILLLQRDHDTAVRLLHPFTGDVAEFPPLESLLPHVRYVPPGEDQWCSVRKIRAAAISVGADGLIRLTMMPQQVWDVSFATSGDQQWRVASWGLHDKIVFSALPFQGKLYLLLLPRPRSALGEVEVMQIDPPQQEQEGLDDIGGSVSVPPPKLVAKFECRTQWDILPVYHLVECNSEIMVIKTGCPQIQFSVYWLADLMLGRTVPLTCLDGNAIFVGSSRLLCVSSKAFPTIVPDTIVVRDYRCYYGEKQYHLNSGTPSHATDVIAEEKHIPGPYSIMCHIFTCCFTASWNKGKMLCQGERKTMRKWRVKRKWRNGG